LAYDRVVENVSGILESPENFCNQESGNPGSRTLGGRKLKEEPANRDSHGKTTIKMEEQRVVQEIYTVADVWLCVRSLLCRKYCMILLPMVLKRSQRNA